MLEKSIKNLNEIVSLSEEEIRENNKNVTAILDLEDLKSLKEIIDYIQQNNHWCQLAIDRKKELEKKDEIIDEMVNFIKTLTVDIKIPYGENMVWDINEIKQYFEKKVNSRKE